MTPQHILELIRIVRLHEVGEVARAQRHALAIRIDLRVTDLLPLIHGRVPHGRIEQPVIAPFENDVVILPCVGAREA